MKLGFPSIAVLTALLLALPASASAEQQPRNATPPIKLAQADGPLVITPQPDPSREQAIQPGSSLPPPQAGSPETRYSRVPQSDAGAPGAPYRPYVPPEAENKGTFSAEEIKETGQRFFGKVSMGFAHVVEYAFQRAGKPNGYILGEEAGGAFIAGLRYGEGTLYTKDAGSIKSIGRARHSATISAPKAPRPWSSSTISAARARSSAPIRGWTDRPILSAALALPSSPVTMSSWRRSVQA